MKITKRIYTPAFPGTYWLRLPYVHDLDERDRRFQCRRTFEIDSIPEHAWINVTGDAKYTLYVNGEFINYGPASRYGLFTNLPPQNYRLNHINGQIVSSMIL